MPNFTHLGEEGGVKGTSGCHCLFTRYNNSLPQGHSQENIRVGGSPTIGGVISNEARRIYRELFEDVMSNFEKYLKFAYKKEVTIK